MHNRPPSLSCSTKVEHKGRMMNYKTTRRGFLKTSSSLAALTSASSVALGSNRAVPIGANPHSLTSEAA
jgi:hypothetical protein